MNTENDIKEFGFRHISINTVYNVLINAPSPEPQRHDARRRHEEDEACGREKPAGIAEIQSRQSAHLSCPYSQSLPANKESGILPAYSLGLGTSPSSYSDVRICTNPWDSTLSSMNFNTLEFLLLMSVSGTCSRSAYRS